ncbi:hypothetical protein [Chryseobacterium sp. R2A-55]|uniref:hypothetical protein n=1 Tax=Chryseobacterium sp. R2A-55 TaxID=2744445 RepID=UPI001F2D503F|nr:hypothetical protein [Chryseobacterium sp. R2A-55]
MKEITATSGQKCPESGIWKVKGAWSTTMPIAKGQVMPLYGERKATWTLLYSG